MKQNIRLVAIGTAAMATLSFALPVLAFAAEEGEETMGIGLLIPKPGEFIPMLIGFIVLWIVLAKLAWPAFMGMIDKRAAKIKEALETAENARIESERVLEEHRAELSRAKKEAADIIATARQTAESVKAEITASAQTEAEILIAKARTAIEAEKKSALAELQGSVADMTVSVTRKVIGTDLSDAEHRSIISRYIAEAGSFNEN
ncbi:MAG: F0F1 ATP synthase subunit B [Coriobacteriales bacterium]|jgi:F-type H+-transporting ATPase subunit b|nr:F0F1 ATP synthase subunit B [Coriobacteriales bacterium]